MAINNCPVCNSTEFSYQAVLWDELIQQWELSAEEVKYINHQQGFYCRNCNNNLRAMALAFSITVFLGADSSLIQAIDNGKMDAFSILEINHAGGLTDALSRLAGHRLITYPEYDMRSLSLPSSEYDLVIHSDTLEHVSKPTTALRECRRILKDSGRCIFTVPIVIGRMSRSRDGLPNSYHGAQNSDESDLLVRTEFGADIWEYVLRAGFRSCRLNSLEYPAGISIEAMA